LTASTARISLEPYGAAIFRSTSAKRPRCHTITVGKLPNLVLSAVPSSLAWQAAAVLTRGKVDTHLFLQFHYSQPLDLSDADCIAIETWVPDGQPTPSQLLVILHEKRGGDFIAETGRSLSVPGRDCTFVTLSRFSARRLV